MTDIAVYTILIAAVFAIIRGIDVRLILFVAGILLASLAGKPMAAFDEFQRVMGEGKIIGPICSAMGYAFLLRATGCDKAMVQIIMRPVQSIRWLVLPGCCMVGFITNAAITSQTAAAAAVGPIIVPLLIAAGFHPLTAAAALVLGCSGGGNLFNPGEPDIVGIQTNTGASVAAVLDTVFLPELLAFIVAMSVFTFIAYKYPPTESTEWTGPRIDPGEKPDILRAILPPLPVLTLLVLQPRFALFPELLSLYPNGLPVVHVMVFYSLIVLMLHIKRISELTRQFFEGLGYGYTHVISLIITASCFIAGLDAVGLIAGIVTMVSGNGPLPAIMSAILPFLLAILSGSGTAPSVAFSKAVLPGLIKAGAALPAALQLGALGAIGATFGRTMSPAAAIILFAAAMAGTTPLSIVKRTALPLLAGLAVAILYIIFSQ
jgi:DcuC family C4-dicarboxylate transporter